MRILHLLPHLSGGGAERQLSYLSQEQIKLGHEVHVANLYTSLENGKNPSIIYHSLKAFSNYDPFLVWKIICLIRRIKPDVIQTWILQMHILGGIAAKFTGTPFILREASTMNAYFGTWKDRLVVRVAYWASAIVSNSRGGDKYWGNEAPKCKRYIIHNGLPLDKIDRCGTWAPTDFSLSEAPIALFIGRLVNIKNVPLLLEAIRIVCKIQKINFILAGDGPQRNELELYVQKFGLEANVRLLGPVSDSSVWSLMKKANLFVSLSAFEGCPNTVLEAMASGCPIVVSDIPSHREILDESSALFVDPWDIPQTTNAILYVLLNKEESKARVLSARSHVENYTVKKMAMGYERVYKSILA